MIFTLGTFIVMLCIGVGIFQSVRDLCERNATARRIHGITFLIGLGMMVCSAGTAIVLGAWRHLP